LRQLSAKGDTLVSISALVSWEAFRADIEAVAVTPDESRRSPAGRKPIDVLMLFRVLVLQSLYNLSDGQVEYQVRDRAFVTRFLGLGRAGECAGRASGAHDRHRLCEDHKIGLQNLAYNIRRLVSLEQTVAM